MRYSNGVAIEVLPDVPATVYCDFFFNITRANVFFWINVMTCSRTSWNNIGPCLPSRGVAEWTDKIVIVLLFWNFLFFSSRNVLWQLFKNWWYASNEVGTLASSAFCYLHWRSMQRPKPEKLMSLFFSSYYMNVIFCSIILLVACFELI